MLAVQPDEVLADPAMEARARELSRELRCMVCQNQSIDDSDAPLARDLRILVRERLKAGDSNDQVLDFLVARYGEFVLMRPTLHGANVLLWVAPFAVLVAGFAGAFVFARRRRQERSGYPRVVARGGRKTPPVARCAGCGPYETLTPPPVCVKATRSSLRLKPARPGQ